MQSDGAAFLLNPNPQWRGCGERGALTLGLPGMGGRCGLQELPVRAESWEPQRPNLIGNRALLVVGVSLFFFFFGWWNREHIQELGSQHIYPALSWWNCKASWGPCKSQEQGCWG